MDQHIIWKPVNHPDIHPGVDISDRYFTISSDGKNVTCAINSKNLKKL